MKQSLSASRLCLGMVGIKLMGENLHTKIIHIGRAVQRAVIHTRSRIANLNMSAVLLTDAVKCFDNIPVIDMLADKLGISLDTHGFYNAVKVIKKHRLHQPERTYNNCRKAQKVEKELFP